MQVRILEVLDDVCDALPLELPAATKKSKKLVKEAVRPRVSMGSFGTLVIQYIAHFAYAIVDIVFGSALRSWACTKTS